jgi:acyl carrier protein
MKEKVTRFIIDDLLSGMDIGEQDDLLLSGLVDSMGVMRLVAFIEEETGLKVSPEDIVIEHFVNIEAIVRYLEARGA